MLFAKSSSFGAEFWNFGAEFGILFVEEEEEEEEEGTDLESDSESIKDLIDHFWKLYVYFLCTLFSIDNFAVPQNDDLAVAT